MIILHCAPISMYCKQTGETLEAVTKRVLRGFWLEGKHVLKVNRVKERWIDLEEVNKWARQTSDCHVE